MKYICEQCGDPFNAPPSQKARFCDRDCYDKSRIGIFKCDNCGKNFQRFKSRAKRYKKNFCSRKCHLEFTQKDIKNQPAFKNGISSYRKIIKQELNRPLKSSELVHHKNKDRTDNRIENLQITTRSEHPKLHPEVGYQKGHPQYNSGRTHFKRGDIPWNKK